MTNILQTMDDVELALRPFVPLVSQLTGADTTLERIKPLMKLLGNPESRLRVVHIAGTSGKTSTSYYIAALLQATGKQIGLTVSPHVDTVRERVQINGQSISKTEFCAELQQFLEIVALAEQQPSYFELLYAFALWVFDKRKVDYAVIETGMGGLFDATNVAERADKLCVLTDIGFDHQHILGNTLAAIAAQKVGIVHRGNVALSYEPSPEVMEVYTSWVTQQGARLLSTTEDAERSKYSVKLHSLPKYQQRNWLLAYRAYRWLAERDGLPTLTQTQLAQTQTVQVPARMEIVRHNGKTIVMDGAHNQQKMNAFIASFTDKYPGVRPTVVVALKNGKEYGSVAPLLAELASTIIVTTFDTSQDLPARSMDTQVLGDACLQAGAADVQIVPDQRQAIALAESLDEAMIVVTGSFYLLSQLRNEALI